MYDLTFLTKKEAETLIEKAAFTDEQLVTFMHLWRGDLSDVGIMMELGVSNNRFYNKIKPEIYMKIIKIAAES